jgi:hypothetical protein
MLVVISQLRAQTLAHLWLHLWLVLVLRLLRVASPLTEHRLLLVCELKRGLLVEIVVLGAGGHSCLLLVDLRE